MNPDAPNCSCSCHGPRLPPAAASEVSAHDEALVLLQFHEWFRPELSRSEVNNLLVSGQPDGAFVIRASTSQKGCNALCMKFGPIVLHFLINRIDKPGKPGACTFHAGNGQIFDSLTQLVAHTLRDKFVGGWGSRSSTSCF